MKRPVPVDLSAILLGLMTACQLLFTILMIAAGFVALKQGLPPTAGPQPFPPSLMPVLMFGLSVISTAFAVWYILTLIGLVRLRSWARYSVLLIAGLMAGFGGISMLTSFAMPFLMPSLPVAAGQTAPDLGMMRIIFFAVGAIYGLIAGLGVALLVYFNRANTRALFQLSAPVRIGPPKTSTGRERPTAISVLSWIFLISAPFCLLYTFMPLPAFVFGFILTGFAARCTYFFFGLLTFAIGYGLYRLRSEARIALYVMFVFLPIQSVVLLTPWGARQLQLAMIAISATMYHGQQSVPNPFSSPAAVIFFLGIGMAFYGFVFWLLQRHREAFTPAPPMPPQPELIEGLTP